MGAVVRTTIAPILASVPPCWCGEEAPHCDDDPYSRTCGGTGTLYCYCGGDQCVCHNHGEVDCPGCGDCAGEDEPWSDDDDVTDDGWPSWRMP
ncbi:MAG: hypothetical protein CMD39_07290 [Gammaproteobacteria bacterium]|nr:hypothetical protein [Gammaproteobacteria bacterium]